MANPGYRLITFLSCIFDFVVLVVYCYIFAKQARALADETIDRVTEESTYIQAMIDAITFLVCFLLFAPRLFVWGWCVISSFDLKTVKAFTVMQGWTNVLLLILYFALFIIVDFFSILNFIVPIIDVVFSCLICFITWRLLVGDEDYKSPDRSLREPLIN